MGRLLALLSVIIVLGYVLPPNETVTVVCVSDQLSIKPYEDYAAAVYCDEGSIIGGAPAAPDAITLFPGEAILLHCPSTRYIIKISDPSTFSARFTCTVPTSAIYLPVIGGGI